MLFAAPRHAVAANRRAEKITAQRVQQWRQAGVDFLTGPRGDGKRLHGAPARQVKRRGRHHTGGAGDEKFDGVAF